jgi:hypothetical protein
MLSEVVAPAANPCLSHALRYADRGFPVFPLHHFDPDTGRCSCGKPDCASPGKHPRTVRGLKDASTDEKAIRAWWRKWPRANLGIVTGAASGLLMVGPDGEQGIADLRALEERHGELPPTVAARSGSGGLHLLFWYPDRCKIPNRRNHLGTKIDVRGEGGYFVAAPSVNAAGNYSWLEDRGPEETQLEAAPPWLVEWCLTDGRVKKEPLTRTVASSDSKDVIARAVAYLDSLPPAISGSGGSAATLWAARVVVYGFDLGPDTGYRLLADNYNPRCRPEWSEKELRHKCAEADSKPFDRPRGWLLSAATEKRQPTAPHVEEPAAPRTGCEIILAYFRERYRPVFRRGAAIYCADGRTVPANEACQYPDSAVIARLALASDAPAANGAVKVSGLPAFFRNWSKVAWGDLFKELPEEDAAKIGGNAPAADEFRRLVREALFTEVVLGETIGKEGEQTRTERRSLIDWCQRFAKFGPWRGVRSKQCWFKLSDLDGGEVGLMVAIRHELFAQLKADRRLSEMGQKRFTRLAAKYGVGQSSEKDRPHGVCAIILDRDFLANLTASLLDEDAEGICAVSNPQIPKEGERKNPESSNDS